MDTRAITEIGSFISSVPGVKGGRPVIAGTGITVKRVAGMHRMGLQPEEMAAQFGHLSLAQIHAALAFYYANAANIDADLDDEEREYERLLAESRKGSVA